MNRIQLANFVILSFGISGSVTNNVTSISYQKFLLIISIPHTCADKGGIKIGTQMRILAYVVGSGLHNHKRNQVEYNLKI